VVMQVLVMVRVVVVIDDDERLAHGETGLTRRRHGARGRRRTVAPGLRRLPGRAVPPPLAVVRQLGAVRDAHVLLDVYFVGGVVAAARMPGRDPRPEDVPPGGVPAAAVHEPVAFDARALVG